MMTYLGLENTEHKQYTNMPTRYPVVKQPNTTSVVVLAQNNGEQTSEKKKTTK